MGTFFELLRKDEENVRRDSADKLSRAERRMQETFGATGASLFDALEANQAQIEQVRGSILDELRRRERPHSPEWTPARPRGVTAETFGLDNIPGLDFEKILAECDAMEAETSRWLMTSPKAPRRLENFEQQISGKM